MMKFDLKSLVLGFLLGSIGLTTAFATTTKKNVEIDYATKSIEIDGMKMEITDYSQPFLLNGRTFVPVRVLAEALGCVVNYNSIDETIYISREIPKYETISQFLMQATDYIGADSPDKVVEVWSEGVKSRNAALQYCVMTRQLKDNYAKDLEEEFENWVTGVSSPWVENYEILKKEKINDTSYTYDLKYHTMSVGIDYPFNVTLKIIKDGDFWRISGIDGDKDSEVYTGYTNSK